MEVVSFGNFWKTYLNVPGHKNHLRNHSLKAVCLCSALEDVSAHFVLLAQVLKTDQGWEVLHSSYTLTWHFISSPILTLCPKSISFFSAVTGKRVELFTGRFVRSFCAIHLPLHRLEGGCSVVFGWSGLQCSSARITQLFSHLYIFAKTTQSG